MKRYKMASRRDYRFGGKTPVERLPLPPPLCTMAPPVAIVVSLAQEEEGVVKVRGAGKTELPLLLLLITSLSRREKERERENVLVKNEERGRNLRQGARGGRGGRGMN